MQMTECLCPLYCFVQSPYSVTQALAVESALPVYMRRPATTQQITELLWPSMVCNEMHRRPYFKTPNCN